MIDLLRQRGSTLALAESVTGGLTQTLICEIPGASDVFAGGVVAYSAAIKETLLGVNEKTIAEYSVVSSQVAQEMADGAREKLNADFALSLTGEAGPQSASGAAVGTVWIGLSSGESTQTFKREYHGDRDAIRRRAAHAALDILRRHLLGLPIA